MATSVPSSRANAAQKGRVERAAVATATDRPVAVQSLRRAATGSVPSSIRPPMSAITTAIATSSHADGRASPARTAATPT